MSTNDIMRRLRAWQSGRPLPRYSTLHHHVAAPEDVLVLAFVRMGGESAPWGVAIGRPDRKPTVFTVPEARNRDLVADMAARLAPVLLEHFRHPRYGGGEVTGPDHGLPLRQVWVPNVTHVDMLHHLAYAYAFTKWGEPARAQTLNALGHLAGWLFREAQRPGQMTLLCATEVLSHAYTFPSDSVRQAHLGFLLAWLQTKGDRDARLAAAAEAETRSISTSLDPLLERDRLERIVDRWGEANREGNVAAAQRENASIAKLLTAEVARRAELTTRAMDVFRSDPRDENPGVAALVSASSKEHWYQYARLERAHDDADDGPAFMPSPETDRYPAAAASRYYVHAASADHCAGVLLHHDPELQEEMIASGDAVRGTIREVWDTGIGKAKVPMWTVCVPDDRPLRIRDDATLCVSTWPKRTVCVRSIAHTATGDVELTIEVTNIKTRPKDAPASLLAATDAGLVGTSVLLLPVARDGISRLKSKRVWERAVPGAWLTHAVPGGVGATLPDEVAETLPSASN